MPVASAFFLPIGKTTGNTRACALRVAGQCHRMVGPRHRDPWKKAREIGQPKPPYCVIKGMLELSIASLLLDEDA